MTPEQFQRAIGTRVGDPAKLSEQEKTELIGLILSDMEALAEAAAQRFHYLWKGWNETENIQVTGDICMLLGCLAEYATTKGYTLSEMMTKAIHLRNQRNDDVGGVN
jgi:hypothetical protein